MQAVILAAGRGKRMGDATNDMPKPMLEVAGKTLLEYKFDALPKEVDEIILVIGWMGVKIHEKFGPMYNGRRIRYVEQVVLNGTMGALEQTKTFLKGRFLAMNGDDIYAQEDIQKCMNLTDGWAALVQKADAVHSGGNIQVDSENKILAILEGEHKGVPGLIGAGTYVLDTRIFDFPMIPKAEGSDEYGLPQTALAAAASLGIPLYAVEASMWIQITDTKDLAEATQRIQTRNS